MSRKLRKSAFALSMAVASVPAMATVFVNQTFDEAGYTVPTHNNFVAPNTTDPAWYLGFNQNSSTPTIATDSGLNGTNALIAAGKNNSGSFPVFPTLGIGDQLSFSFDFRLPNLPATPTNTTKGLVFGIFGDNSTPVTADFSSAPGNANSTDDLGYSGAIAVGTVGDVSLWRDNPGGNATGLDPVDTIFANNTAKAGSLIDDQNKHTALMTITRTGTTTDVVSVSLDGNVMFTATDTTTSDFSFNDIQISTTNSVALAQQQFNMDNVSVVATGPSTWLGGSNTSWETSGNWQGNIITSGAGNIATFGGTTAVTSNLSSNETVGGLTFTNSNTTTISANTGLSLTLDNAGLGVAISAIGGNVTISAPVILNGNVTAMVNGGNTLTISGAISSTTSKSITKAGCGTLILTNTNTYTGGTTINAGTLLLSGAVNMPSTGTLTVNAGGNFSLADGTARTTTTAALSLASGANLTFDWNAGSVDTLTSTAAATVPSTGTVVVGITINNNSPTGSGGTLISAPSGGLITATTTYYLANNTNFTATLTQSATAVSIGSQTAVAALTNAYWLGNKVTGALGAMALSSVSTSNWASAASGTLAGGVVPGGTAVNVIFGATGASQQASVTTGANMTLSSITFNDSTAVTIAGSNYLSLNSTSSTAASTTAALATVTPGAAISVTSFANATNTISANINLAVNQTWDIANNKTLVVSGIVVGTGSLAKTDTGTLTLSNANNYSGGTTISAGTLKIGNPTALGNAGAASVTSGAVLDLNGTPMIATNPLTLNGTGISSNGALIDSSATPGTYAGLITLGSASSIVAGTGNITISNTGTITGSGFGLTLGGAATGSSIASIIGTNTGTLTKQGAGTWTVSGANTYTGGTTISAGTLKIGNATALGGNAGAASVTSGAVLDLNGTTMTATNGLTLNGTGISSGGALTNSSASPGAYAGLITLGSASSFVANSGNIIVSNTGTITGSGFGLTLGGTATGSSIASNIGTTTGTLTKQGTGTWTVTGANTYTGNTTITAGTLALSGSGSIANSAHINLNGGSFDVSGVSASPYAIGASQTLLGSGTVVGPITVNGTLQTGQTNNVAGKSAATLTLGSGSTLAGSTLMDLTAANTSDEVVFSNGAAGTATLGGTLTVTNPNGITFAAGQSYDLFNFNGNTEGGTFSNLPAGLPTLSGSLVWNTSLLYSSGIISIGSNASLLSVGPSHLLLRSMVNGSQTGSVTLSNSSSTDDATYSATPDAGLTATTATGSVAHSGSTNVTIGFSDYSTTGPRTGSVSISNTANVSDPFNPTSVTLDSGSAVVDNRVITAGNVSLSPVHVNGTGSGTTTLATSGDDNHFTRPTIDGVLFNTAAVTTTQNVTSPVFNTPGLAQVATAPSVPFTTAVGEGLIGETVQTTVSVGFTADVFNGAATSTTAGNYSALDWTDSNGVLAAPGTFAGFTTTDSATFNGAGGMVTLDVPVSLNSLALNNAGSYTLAGTNTLSLAGTSPTPTVSVTGTHSISAPVTLVNDTTVTTNSGVSSIGISGNINGAGKLTTAGTGSVTLSGSNSYGGGTDVSAGTLNVESTTALPANSALSVEGTLVVNRNGNGEITLNLASLSNTGLIDLQNNAMVINGANGGTYNAVNTMLKAGFTSSQNWSGSTGITTSTLGGSNLYTLGEALNGSTLTVGYAYYGDADMNGVVDGNDYTMIDTGFGGGGTGWQYGDFNYDGVIDGSDYSLIDNAFNTQTGSAPAIQVAANTAEIAGGSAVPEPASLGLLGIGALGLMSRRRRKF
jgi:autotransporter-associated beta strand protein